MGQISACYGVTDQAKQDFRMSYGLALTVCWRQPTERRPFKAAAGQKSTQENGDET
jgi:hypothetical protein